VLVLVSTTAGMKTRKSDVLLPALLLRCPSRLKLMLETAYRCRSQQHHQLPPLQPTLRLTDLQGITIITTTVANANVSVIWCPPSSRGSTMDFLGMLKGTERRRKEERIVLRVAGRTWRCIDHWMKVMALTMGTVGK